jgi:hypothetical protein
MTEAIDLRAHLAEFRDNEFLVRAPAIALGVHRRRLGVKIEVAGTERYLCVQHVAELDDFAAAYHLRRP